MYNKIRGPDTVNKDITHAYVWVIPKSGTVFLSIFMNVYSELLKTGTIADKHLNYSYPSTNLFGKADFGVEHSECPGYKETEISSEILNKWKSLQYHDQNWAGSIAKTDYIASKIIPAESKHLDINSDTLSQKCRIVFVYRNFLDQSISHYRQYYNELPTKESLEDFIFHIGVLNSYIKIFTSFSTVSKKYPELILFLPYEEIVTNKIFALRRLIEHLGIPYDEEAFLRAIELTSIENLRAFENKLGHSLLRNDNSTPRHIRDGGIGIWQLYMTENTIKRIEDIMNQFGLSLTMFNLASTIDPKFNFLYNKDKSSAKLRP